MKKLKIKNLKDFKTDQKVKVLSKKQSNTINGGNAYNNNRAGDYRATGDD